MGIRKDVEMQRKSRWQIFVLFIAGYCLLAWIFYWIIQNDWKETSVASESVNRDAIIHITGQTVVEEDFFIETDSLRSLSLVFSPLMNPALDDEVSLWITDEAEQLLWQETCKISDLKSNDESVFSVHPWIEGYKSKQATLHVRMPESVSLWYGTTRSAGKINVKADASSFRVGGENVTGELVMRQQGILIMPYSDLYWPVIFCLGIVILVMMVFLEVRRVHGRPGRICRVLDLLQQYRFLLKTLVVRDFKVKYKASLLGVFWSFLNPLLMTFVYMFVFSTIFQSTIDHFVVYLMSGIVLFNYFSESTNLAMASIVGNAGLITKVYIPKYIFPVSKVLSSAINLAISLIPLFIMMAMTGVSFHKSLLLMPLLLVLLIVFCTGVGLLLSACMVFFRDVQFLWGIMLTVWNFFSPIFYPESIIPARFIHIYHMNPLYQYLFFMRTITIGGISPTPVTYLYCFLASFFFLALGLLVFRKAQKTFVLHL